MLTYLHEEDHPMPQNFTVREDSCFRRSAIKPTPSNATINPSLIRQIVALVTETTAMDPSASGIRVTTTLENINSYGHGNGYGSYMPVQAARHRILEMEASRVRIHLS